jgi:hypothetical protein
MKLLVRSIVLIFLNMTASLLSGETVPETRVKIKQNTAQEIIIADPGSNYFITDIPAEPSHGRATISVNAKSIKYVPNLDYLGADQILYQRSDNKPGIIYLTIEQAPNYNVSPAHVLEKIITTQRLGASVDYTHFSTPMLEDILLQAEIELQKSKPAQADLHEFKDRQNYIKIIYAELKELIKERFAQPSKNSAPPVPARIDVEKKAPAVTARSDSKKDLNAGPKNIRSNRVLPTPPAKKINMPDSQGSNVEKNASELEAELKLLLKKFREVSIKGASVEVARMGQRIEELNKRLEAKLKYEQQQKSSQINEPSASGYIDEQSILSGAGAGLKKRTVAASTGQREIIVPSKPNIWNKMSVEELNREYNVINQALIKNKLSDTLDKKSTNTRQLEVDLEYVKNKLKELEVPEENEFV